jgi:hypothetical protein
VNAPRVSFHLEVQIDYGALCVYDQANQDDPASDTVERALDAAEGSLRVGQADKLVVLSTPVQYNYATPMRVEVWADEPADDSAGWDHVVDIDLDLPTGQLRLRPNGPTDEAVSCEVPAGTYRARLAGRGYDHTNPQGGGLDDYRVQLWPRASDSEPVLVKSWPGWAKLFG